MGNDVLSLLDLALALIIELVDLVRCDLGELCLQLLSLHLGHFQFFVDKAGQVYRLLTCLPLIKLLSELLLEDLQDLALLLFLLIV